MSKKGSIVSRQKQLRNEPLRLKGYTFLVTGLLSVDHGFSVKLNKSLHALGRRKRLRTLMTRYSTPKKKKNRLHKSLCGR